jgi:hypothetical protein
MASSARFAHYVLRTNQLAELTRWCCDLLDAHVVFTGGKTSRPPPSRSARRRVDPNHLARNPRQRIDADGEGCAVSCNSEDAVQRKRMTGKTVRMIRNKVSEPWEQPGAAQARPAQNILFHGARIRIEKAHRDDLCSFPAGQVVGNMKEETSVHQVERQLMQEYIDTAERMQPLVNL